jgi:hypothetical protein
MARSMPTAWIFSCLLPLSSTALAQQSYVTSYFALELDGAKAGVVHSVEGGNISADVFSRGLRNDSFAKKHIGQPNYEDISLRLGLGSNEAIHDWIEATWNKHYVRKNGSIVSTDYDFTIKREREFLNALLTETTIPACDASSKDIGFLTMKLDPESIRESQRGGQYQLPANPKKQWLSSNFRFELEGLESRYVTKVDSFTVKYKAPLWRQRGPGAGQIEFPNLKITLPERHAESWRIWHEDFVIQGNNSDEKEKSGALLFMDPTLSNEILRIELNQCGIFRLAEARSPTGILLPGYVTAEIYCERLKFVSER